MNNRLRIAAIIGAIGAAIIIFLSPNSSIPIPEPVLTSNTNNAVEIIATHLEKPRSLVVWNDTIFLTEKTGRIRIIQNNTLIDEPLTTLRTVDVYDGGLSGITIHPNFSENHYLYVYYTYEENKELWNKILKITVSENKLKDATVLLDKIPGSPFVNGGMIKFGPDGKLYVGTGSVSDSSHLAQDKNSLAGKILRINDDGTIPNDNPFPDSLIFAMGFRNPRGMAWDDDGNLFVADEGPTKNDEINLIQPGQNYGWPEQQCNGNQLYVDSLVCYDPGIEPGGILFYHGDRLPYSNQLIISSLQTSSLYATKLDENSGLKAIFGGIGRIRDVAEGNDGSLYIITSNTDGKGFPDKNDDKLVRILR